MSQIFSTAGKLNVPAGRSKRHRAGFGDGGCGDDPAPEYHWATVELSLQMTKLKNIMQTAGVLVLLYVLMWAFGDHGHTYYLQPAKQVGTVWSCAQEEDGPFWENGKDRDPVCHDPARQCPALWFPYVTEVPCPYKDPLGGPYTKEDLLVLEQIKHPRR